MRERELCQVELSCFKWSWSFEESIWDRNHRRCDSGPRYLTQHYVSLSKCLNGVTPSEKGTCRENPNRTERKLRGDVWNYRESGVSREISNFFIFRPSNLYIEFFSKITLKVLTAFYFSEIGQSLKIRHIGHLRIVKLAENYTFSSRSYVKTRCRLLTKHKHNIHTLNLFITLLFSLDKLLKWECFGRKKKASFRYLK